MVPYYLVIYGIITVHNFCRVMPSYLCHDRKNKNRFILSTQMKAVHKSRLMFVNDPVCCLCPKLYKLMNINSVQWKTNSYIWFVADLKISKIVTVCFGLCLYIQCIELQILNRILYNITSQNVHVCLWIFTSNLRWDSISMLFIDEVLKAIIRGPMSQFYVKHDSNKCGK